MHLGTVRQLVLSVLFACLFVTPEVVQGFTYLQGVIGTIAAGIVSGWLSFDRALRGSESSIPDYSSSDHDWYQSSSSSSSKATRLPPFPKEKSYQEYESFNPNGYGRITIIEEK